MPTTPQLAIVTSSNLPTLFGGEKLLLPELAQRGITTSICVWDDPAVDWKSFDAILIRCPWDYHEKLPAFLQWLDRLRTLQVKVINDLDTLQWNLNKKYLFELSQQGLRVIPSWCLSPSDTQPLTEMMTLLASQELVVKPVQSAGAWRTLRVNRDNLEQVNGDFSHWRREQEFLVQPFMPEIMQEGEWSLIFFQGQYSHALIKRAKTGDFRVQSDHGGSVHTVEAPEAMQAQARQILHAVKRMPCYARVDGVVRDGQFMLMELELLEPELFLELDSQAPQRFAQAIVTTLSMTE